MVRLEEQIKQREKQAEDRQIGEKAGFVAMYLGKTTETSNHERQSRLSLYRGGDLAIEDDDFFVDGSDGGLGGFGTEISYKGRQVFKTGGGTLYSYIPGQ